MIISLELATKIGGSTKTTMAAGLSCRSGGTVRQAEADYGVHMVYISLRLSASESDHEILTSLESFSVLTCDSLRALGAWPRFAISEMKKSYYPQDASQATDPQSSSENEWRCTAR